MSTTPEGQLKVTIATLPSGSGLAMVGRDVELVRATLLYADEIEIVSPAAQMLDSVLAAARNPDGMLDLLLEAGAGLLDGKHSEDELRQTQQVIAAVRSPEWRARLAQLPPDTEEGTALRDFFAKTEETLREASAQMKATVADLDARSGLTALQPAIDQGIVTIHRAGYLGAEGSDEVVTRFVDHLDRLMGDVSTQLLLDDGLADLVRARGAGPSPFVERNAQEAFVGSGLITRLPTLQTLPVDELLDLRSELTVQRRKYLRAVSSLSQKMTTTAFAPERADELDHLWRTDVGPALDDLRSQLVEHSLVRELARRAGSDARTFVAATGVGGFGWLSLGVLRDVDLMAALVAAAPAAGVAATSFFNALQGRRSGQREATTQDLYYLVALAERSS